MRPDISFTAGGPTPIVAIGGLAPFGQEGATAGDDFGLLRHLAENVAGLSHSTNAQNGRTQAGPIRALCADSQLE